MSASENICFIGMVEIDKETKSFGILQGDRRRHMYILGKSGTGKSTLIENLVLQDIYAGHGVCFLDPLGDSAESIIDRIPSYRIKDVIYFDPSDFDFPIGINMLESSAVTPKFLVAANLMSVMKRLWEGAWSSRMEYILGNTISALLDVEGNSLIGVMKMFSDKQFRKYIAENIQNLVVKNFWQNEFPSFSDSYKNEALAAIQNKIGQFFASDLIRNILGQQKSSIDFRQIMDEQKIFIANLSKGRLGEDNAGLLGSMLVTKFQLAAMSRVDMPEKNRKDFYLYADEFQNLITDSFATILSEARKYRLNLIVAHQYLAQLSETENEKVRNAIFGNVGTVITFQVGADDAEVLVKEFGIKEGLGTPEDTFLNLDRGQIIVKLFIQSKTIEPFFANTLPPLYTDFQGSKKFVIDSSRKQFSRPRLEVEKEIEAYYTKSIIATDSGEIIRARVPKRKRKEPGQGVVPEDQLNLNS